MKPVRVPVELMKRLTVAQERNIYIHPNPLAREIFWQRIERLGQRIEEHVAPTARGLDFGGGSGSLVPFWAQWGGAVDLVDLDVGDARRLAEHFGAAKVRIIQADIARHQVPPYDFIVAADVLEHFPSLDFPVQHLRRLLKPDGLLFISVPTENFLYELGRKLVRKSKPADHFHPSAEIVAFLEKAGFRVLRSEHVPKFVLVAIPLFQICLLTREPSFSDQG